MVVREIQLQECKWGNGTDGNALRVGLTRYDLHPCLKNISKLDVPLRCHSGADYGSR